MVNHEPYRITVTGDNNTISIINHPHIHRGYIEWTISLPNGFKIRGKNMAFVLPDDKTAALSITPVDVKGNAAAVEGAPVWSVSDESLLTIVTAEDGMSATIAAVGPLGTAQVNVTADADLGEGVTAITGLLEVQIVASAAVGLQISAAVVVPPVEEPVVEEPAPAA